LTLILTLTLRAWLLQSAARNGARNISKGLKRLYCLNCTLLNYSTELRYTGMLSTVIKQILVFFIARRLDVS